jgi:hypothetical protein
VISTSIGRDNVSFMGLCIYAFYYAFHHDNPVDEKCCKAKAINDNLQCFFMKSLVKSFSIMLLKRNDDR